MVLNPWNYRVKPTLDEVPTLSGGGSLIVFDSDDQPVLPQFKPASAGEVRKVTWFARAEDGGGDWWFFADSGCTEGWLSEHPDYGTGPLTEAEIRHARTFDSEMELRTITWTASGEILRDVRVPAVQHTGR